MTTTYNTIFDCYNYQVTIVDKATHIVKKYSDDYWIMWIDCRLQDSKQGIIIAYGTGVHVTYLASFKPKKQTGKFKVKKHTNNISVDDEIMIYEITKMLESEYQNIKQ